MVKDVTQTHYMKKPVRIADLLDGYYFNGARVIRPEDIKKGDGKLIFYKNGKPDEELIERYQDLVFEVVKGVNCFIFCVEEQNYVDPSMVLRSLEYTVGQYGDQRDAIKDYHESAGDLLAKVIGKYSHSKKVLKMIENMEKEEKTERKEETIDMMDALDEICEDYRKAGIEEGKKAGMEAGRKEGIKEGEKQFGDLILCLLSENRADDIERVSRDSEYRERLLAKYKIIG